MGLVRGVGEFEGQVGPREVGPCADVEHPVAGTEQLVLVVQLEQPHCRGYLVLLVVLNRGGRT